MQTFGKLIMLALAVVSLAALVRGAYDPKCQIYTADRWTSVEQVIAPATAMNQQCLQLCSRFHLRWDDEVDVDDSGDEELIDCCCKSE